MAKPYSGKFIVFEGPDGSGESTQAKLLADYLQKKGIDLITTKEPTHESEAGQKIAKALKHEIKVEPKEFQELYVLDRKSHLENLILPALEQGKIVISDRYFFSTFAFGSLACDFDWLVSINKDFPFPDLTFVLNVAPEICIERIQKRGKAIEFFETKEKLTKVMATYQKIVQMFPSVYLIDGERSIEEIHQEIIELTSKIL